MPELPSIERARATVLAEAGAMAPEPVAVGDALGRVLRADARASTPVPPFDNSAMDGFAVADTTAGTLDVVGESRAGTPFSGPLGAGEAVRISTGAPVPAGTAAVVPVERVEEGTGRVTVPSSPPGDNVRRAGEDVEAGATVLEAGAELGPAALGVLASLGLGELSVGPRPRVAIVATGDELVAPGAPLGPGEIYSSNPITLAAEASLAGAEVVFDASAPDDLAQTRAVLEGALEAADVVIASGGVSVGPHDHVKPALAELGVQERFWRVALRPGKPTWFGVRPHDSKAPALVFGLPGNPVSSMVCFQLFVRPALRALQGADPLAARASALLGAPVERLPARDHAVRCALRTAPEGLVAHPTGEQGSHVLTSMLGADALALVAAGEGRVERGDPVEVELLRSWARRG